MPRKWTLEQREKRSQLMRGVKRGSYKGNMSIVHTIYASDEEAFIAGEKRLLEHKGWHGTFECMRHAECYARGLRLPISYVKKAKIGGGWIIDERKDYF